MTASRMVKNQTAIFFPVAAGMPTCVLGAVLRELGTKLDKQRLITVVGLLEASIILQ